MLTALVIETAESHHLLLTATLANFACCQLQTAAQRNGLKMWNLTSRTFFLKGRTRESTESQLEERDDLLLQQPDFKILKQS